MAFHIDEVHRLLVKGVLFGLLHQEPVQNQVALLKAPVCKVPGLQKEAEKTAKESIGSTDYVSGKAVQRRSKSVALDDIQNHADRKIHHRDDAYPHIGGIYGAAFQIRAEENVINRQDNNRFEAQP